MHSLMLIFILVGEIDISLVFMALFANEILNVLHDLLYEVINNYFSNVVAIYLWIIYILVIKR